MPTREPGDRPEATVEICARRACRWLPCRASVSSLSSLYNPVTRVACGIIADRRITRLWIHCESITLLKGNHMSLLLIWWENVDARARARIRQEKIWPGVLAVLLGVVLIYGAGFAATDALHNAAHDGRHSASFPCH